MGILDLKMGLQFSSSLSYFYIFITCLTNMRKISFYFHNDSRFIVFKHISCFVKVKMKISVWIGISVLGFY